ncbi:MAG: hypothetical protein ABIJ08_06005 [Nanoarchaeota archaeon]
MKKEIGIIIAFLAITAGLISIFRLAVDTEIAIGFVTISFGILAIIWTSMAISSLSNGSSLRRHIINFLLCLIFVLLFSIWHTISKLFAWRQTVNEAMLYPGYIFLIFAFLIFVMTAYQILLMGKEFGFGNKTKEIKELMGKRKRLKSKKAAD